MHRNRKQAASLIVILRCKKVCFIQIMQPIWKQNLPKISPCIHNAGNHDTDIPANATEDRSQLRPAENSCDPCFRGI